MRIALSNLRIRIKNTKSEIWKAHNCCLPYVACTTFHRIQSPRKISYHGVHFFSFLCQLVVCGIDAVSEKLKRLVLPPTVNVEVVERCPEHVDDVLVTDVR